VVGSSLKQNGRVAEIEGLGIIGRAHKANQPIPDGYGDLSVENMADGIWLERMSRRCRVTIEE
jgi:hypothetical protein